MGSDVQVSDSRCYPPNDLLHHASLFLDFDGTLVQIARRPEEVQVDERLQNLMRTLVERLDGRIAVISGRPATQIRGLLGDLIITVAGSHGLEVSDASGSETFAARPASLDLALPAMEKLAGACPGVMVEKKPLGAALHFREAPEAEARCLALASELAAQHGLLLQPGKMVVELRAAGGDKGTAIRWLANRQMAGHRPVFIGDDITDEAGFVAAADLGGAGILVGPPRPTAARYRLEGVEAVLGWLEQAAKS